MLNSVHLTANIKHQWSSKLNVSENIYFPTTLNASKCTELLNYWIELLNFVSPQVLKKLLKRFGILKLFSKFYLSSIVLPRKGFKLQQLKVNDERPFIKMVELTEERKKKGEEKRIIQASSCFARQDAPKCIHDSLGRSISKFDFRSRSCGVSSKSGQRWIQNSQLQKCPKRSF